MPKPRGARLATATVERHRRRETSVEEAMIETCLAGVPAGRIEGVSEALRGPGASAPAVPDPDERAFASVEGWRSRPLERAYPHACVDGTCLRRGWGGSCENVAVTVAIGADDDGYREAVGAAEGLAESSECWRELLSWPRSRGLRGVRTLAGDRAAGMAGPVDGAFPGAAHQGRAARSCRSVLARAPRSKGPRVAAMLKAIHATGSREASEAKC